NPQHSSGSRPSRGESAGASDKSLRAAVIRPAATYSRDQIARKMAEGLGFEPRTGFSPCNRLAGGRTRPLCDPSRTLAIIAQAWRWVPADDRGWGRGRAAQRERALTPRPLSQA